MGEILESSTLSNIVGMDRVAILSPFTNFNVVLGLNIAYTLSHLVDREIHLTISHSVPIEVVREILKECWNVLLLHEFKCIDNSYAHIIISSTVDIEKLLQCCMNTAKVFMIAGRIYQLHRLRDMAWRVYRARRVDSFMYSLVDVHRGVPIILEVKGHYVHQVEIPEDAMLIYREVVDRVSEFGSIKASALLRYMVRTLGYDRDFVLNAIRKSIAIGIVRYQSGYLLPVPLDNT